jgi:hypothetical protein
MKVTDKNTFTWHVYPLLSFNINQSALASAKLIPLSGYFKKRIEKIYLESFQKVFITKQ